MSRKDVKKNNLLLQRIPRQIWASSTEPPIQLIIHSPIKSNFWYTLNNNKLVVYEFPHFYCILDFFLHAAVPRDLIFQCAKSTKNVPKTLHLAFTQKFVALFFGHCCHHLHPILPLLQQQSHHHHPPQCVSPFKVVRLVVGWYDTIAIVIFVVIVHSF